MTFAEAALLGVVQGLTEFLPVSSSAHLILARAFFGESAGDPAFYLAFDVACHVGTLAAVLLFFRSDIAGLIRAVPFAARGPDDARARRLWLVGVGTVPAVLAGVLFNDAIQAMRTPLVAAIALAVGALLLFAIERLGVQGHGEERLSLGGALAIEIARTPAEMERGLMYRERLDADRGMLFLYEDDREVAFWMKNTLIPLDLIFADASGRIVAIAERAVPLSTALIPSPGPVRAVLEVNGGTARRLHIQVGDRLLHPALSR